MSLFILLFIAVAVGWYLGRSTVNVADSAKTTVSPGYYRGINYLINESSDGAIQAFIQSLPVNEETFELHVALGNLLRKKGEVDGAIRIHQNLLSRPSLSQQLLNKAHLELARDYISAGLLDRAERLLDELINGSEELKDVSLQLMLEIFQNEKEWQQAIRVAEQLRPRRRRKRDYDESPELATAVSHYYCELAEIAVKERSYRLARENIKAAISADKQCVRASMLAAQVDIQLGQIDQAVKSLKKIREQDAEFLPEIVPLLKEVYQQTDDCDQLLHFLKESNQLSASTEIILAATDVISRQHGAEAAMTYLGHEMQRRPTLKGLSELIADKHFHADEVGNNPESFGMLRSVINSLLGSKPRYHCTHCGFSGMRLHWLCPGCQQWGKIKRIKGVEGD